MDTPLPAPVHRWYTPDDCAALLLAVKRGNGYLMFRSLFISGVCQVKDALWPNRLNRLAMPA